VFYALDLLLDEPFNAIMTVLPNLAYFLADDGSGSSLLQQSIDRAIFALDSVVGSVMGENALFSIDVTGIIDDLLRSLNLGLCINLLSQLHIGTLTEYASLSGYAARYVSVTRNDQADVLTIVLRQLLNSARDRATRINIAEVIGHAIGLGAFGRWILRVSLHAVFFIERPFARGTEILIRLLFITMRIVTPIIGWFA
jgi:hypothetical protein